MKRTRTTPRAPAPAALAALAACALSVVLGAGCSGGSDTTETEPMGSLVTAAPSSSAAATVPTTAPPTTPVTTAAEPTAAGGDDGLGAVGTLASDAVHTIAVEFDEQAYDTMIDTFLATDDKDWIEAAVTIDGTRYEQAGIRLKGNSSLNELRRPSGGRSPAADVPESLPWLIKLDEYVDGQNHDGLVEFAVRSNRTATSLNEAVALELIGRAGLAAQDAIASAFSVNGGADVLRLVVENPDDVWMAEAFDSTGALYQAEATGDFSYRGDDPDSYADVFDQEAGRDNADLTPVIELLQFVNESDDATFAAELPDRLDADSFATYLSMQDLVDNFDDINGPGNNAYLYYEPASGRFTVVPWDFNLAFSNATGAAVTEDCGGVNGATRRPNVLVDRFLAVPEWAATCEQRRDDLRAALFDSGVAADLLDRWSAIVASSGLVDESTIDTEAEAIRAML